MYSKVECVMLECDNCGELYQNDHSGFSIFVDEAQAKDDANNHGWDLHHDNGKHYCGECHHYNDNDELVVNESRTKPPTPPQEKDKQAPESKKPCEICGNPDNDCDQLFEDKQAPVGELEKDIERLLYNVSQNVEYKKSITKQVFTFVQSRISSITQELNEKKKDIEECLRHLYREMPDEQYQTSGSVLKAIKEHQSVTNNYTLELESQLSTLTQELSTKEDEIKDLQKFVEEQKQGILEYVQELSEVRESRQRMQIECLDLVSQLSEVKAENERLKTKNHYCWSGSQGYPYCMNQCEKCKEAQLLKGEEGKGNHETKREE